MFFPYLGQSIFHADFVPSLEDAGIRLSRKHKASEIDDDEESVKKSAVSAEDYLRISFSSPAIIMRRRGLTVNES